MNAPLWQIKQNLHDYTIVVTFRSPTDELSISINRTNCIYRVIWNILTDKSCPKWWPWKHILPSIIQTIWLSESFWSQLIHTIKILLCTVLLSEPSWSRYNQDNWGSTFHLCYLHRNEICSEFKFYSLTQTSSGSIQPLLRKTTKSLEDWRK